MLDHDMINLLTAVIVALKNAHVVAVHVGGDGGPLKTITVDRDGRVGMGSKGITITLTGANDAQT